MKIRDNRVMEMNNLISAFYNSDHDGDNMIAGGIHSTQGRRDALYMHIINNVEFEHRDKLLLDFEHESIYGAYIITKEILLNTFENDILIDIPNFDNFKLFREELLTMDFLKESLHKKYLVQIGDIVAHPITHCINRSLQLFEFNEEDQMELFYNPNKENYKNYIFKKKNLTSFFYLFYLDLKKKKQEETFWIRTHEFDKFILELSSVNTEGIASFSMNDFCVESDEITEYKQNLIQVEPYIAFQQNMILFNDFIRKSIEHDPKNILNKVFDSGARLKSVQLLKAASNSGIPTDIYGKAFPVNIGNSLLDGLTQDEYFQTGDSARLALMQRQDSIPKGGELQRKFFFSTGILKFRKDIEDCQSDIDPVNQKLIKIKIENKDHLKSMNHRYFLKDDKLEKIDLFNGDYDYMIGNEYMFRSPRSCVTEDFGICKTCFGAKTPSSKHVGASLGSYIAESIIQSVLRTHHFGGAFITEERDDIQNILRKAIFRGPDTIFYTDDESLGKIEEYLYTKYDNSNIEFERLENDDGLIGHRLIVHELPYNDDSVKILNQIVSLIDKNREDPDIQDIYKQLVPIIAQNDILSVYFELILSLLFYDEDDTLIRYSDKPVKKQIALKNIIERLDPKLSIFYNFSDRAISNVYKAKYKKSTTHMYSELLDMYY